MIPLALLSDEQRKRINRAAFRFAFRLGDCAWLPPRVTTALQHVAEGVRAVVVPAGAIVVITDSPCHCRESEGLSVGDRLVVKRPVSGWFDYVMEYTPTETWMGHYVCPMNFRVIWVPADGLAARPSVHKAAST